MRILKRRIRAFFVLQAIILLAAAARSLVNPAIAKQLLPEARHEVFLAVCVGLALVFAGAFLTTRKPSPFRNPWAIAASLVSITAGAYLVWLSHSALASAARGLITIVIGIAGLYLYSEGGASRKSQAENPSAESAQYTSLGRRPRYASPKIQRAEGPTQGVTAPASAITPAVEANQGS